MEQETIQLEAPISPDIELMRLYVDNRPQLQGLISFTNRVDNHVWRLDKNNIRTGETFGWNTGITAEQTDFLTENLLKHFVYAIELYVDNYDNSDKAVTYMGRYPYEFRSIYNAMEAINNLVMELECNELDNKADMLQMIDLFLQDMSVMLEEATEYEKEQLQIQIDDETRKIGDKVETIALIDSLLSVYSKADSVLSGSSIDVEAINNPEMNAPACTDGKKITFNKAKLHALDDLSNERLTELNGLNYHELSHILFSPRKNAEISKWARTNKLFAPLQLLEDIRIEMMMINKYPSTKPFFEVAVTTYILKNKPVFSELLFARVYGAKYLSLDVRQDVVDIIKSIVKHDDLIDIMDIVDKYQKVAYPKHTAEAKELVKRFSKYYSTEDLNNESQMGCDDISNMKHGSGESQTKQEQLNNKPDIPDGLDMSDSSSNKSDTETNPTDTKCSSPSQELAERVAKREALQRKLEQFISNINDTKVVQEKNKELRKAVSGDHDYDNNLKQANYSEYTPLESYRIMATKFGNELEKIRQDLDPMWIQEVPSGRLNIQRAMKRDINSLDTLFDRWHEGSDACDIEAVILLDNSSSMYSQMAETCQAGWVIKRGIEKVNGEVTILSFNERTYTIYDKETKANTRYRGIGSNGATDPIMGLDVAIQIFKKSRRQTKVLFIVTDGQWSNETANNVRVQICNDLGVLTSLVYIDQDTSEYYKQYIASMPEHEFNHLIRHNCRYFNRVSTPQDLTKVAVDIVKTKLKEGYAR